MFHDRAEDTNTTDKTDPFIAAVEAARDGADDQAATADRACEKNPTLTAAKVVEAVEPAPNTDGEQLDEGYPDLTKLAPTKLPHRNLILHGVTSHCAHCGQDLTDAVSVQRGIGPICSRKGYSEDPVEADEIQAMIDLAPWPELVEFLTTHYKPLGIRGLVNGLVRVCSLNRPRGRGQKEGNAKVFDACCDAIENLGHRKMAAILRNTLAVVSLKNSEQDPGCVEVWVKKSEWTPSWSQDCFNKLAGAKFDKKRKAMIIPLYKPDHIGDASHQRLSKVTQDNVRLTNREVLWGMLVHHYNGCVLKKGKESVKIKP